MNFICIWTKFSVNIRLSKLSLVESNYLNLNSYYSGSNQFSMKTHDEKLSIFYLLIEWNFVFINFAKEKTNYKTNFKRSLQGKTLIFKIIIDLDVKKMFQKCFKKAFKFTKLSKETRYLCQCSGNVWNKKVFKAVIEMLLMLFENLLYTTVNVYKYIEIIHLERTSGNY